MPEHALKNRLAEATSPYLLQHADNPVAWQPWDDKAIEAARALDRPILLSSGYSSCHWCHVMAHESFEDEETAAMMNEFFVNIKLDREERPDLDMVYQTAHSLLARAHGGWPLTAFLSAHTLRPFFCGTYFPKEPRHGLPSFKDVLRSVAQYYREQSDAVEKIGEHIRNTLENIYTLKRATVDLPDNLSRRAADEIALLADRVNGGFGNAPKFPQPGYIHCLLRRCADEPAKSALRLTLSSICRRGLYDHVGGGFFRYCTDARWTIPHFEKMLYDNGLLLGLLADAREVCTEPLFRDAAINTARWLEREMQSEEGAYYCALDADGPDGEGAYYLWRDEEIKDACGERAADVAHRFGLDAEPNFEGRWHLVMQNDAPRANADAATFRNDMRETLETLRRLRDGRTPPALDDKCLTSWNALAIKGMAKVAHAFDDAPALASAERALDCVKRVLWRDGRLHGGVCQGAVHDKVFLSDYAFLIDAILEMLQHRWRSDELQWALQLADQLPALFEDAETGGYYFTPRDADDPVQRPVAFHDDALPSGYGVAALVLARLGHLCDRPHYVESARKAVERASAALCESPAQCASLLYAYEEYLNPPEIVVVRADADAKAWRAAAMRSYRPHRLAFVIPADAPELPPMLEQCKAKDAAAAYVCSGTACRASVGDPDALAELLA